MMKNSLLIGLSCVLLGLGGCATKHAAAPTTGSGAASGAATTDSGASTSGLAAASATAEAGAPATAGPTGGLLGKRIVYFDFDRAEIRADMAEIVAAHARYVAGHAGARVRLEGHTDERGTREYNIGLGERRAQAVKRALMLQGVAETQLTTVSYGEERPAASGHDESAWSQNRRVEIVYISP